MKRFIIFSSFSLLLISSGIYAIDNIFIGADFNLDRNAESRSSDYNSTSSSSDTSSTSIFLQPFVGLKFNRFELRPAIGFGNRVSKSRSETSSSTATEYKISQSSLVFAIGGHFYVIENDMFRFIIGGTIPFTIFFKPSRKDEDGDIEDNYDKFSNTKFEIGIPFSLDFVPAEHIGFRISNSLFSWSIYTYNIKLKNSDTRTKSTSRSTESMFSRGIDSFTFSIFFIF